MRGDYDYNHTALQGLSTQMLIVLVIIIMCLGALGGLFIGLTILT